MKNSKDETIQKTEKTKKAEERTALSDSDMGKREKKQSEELANAGGVELTDEQMNTATGGALPSDYALNLDSYVHCPKCNSVNLRYNDGKERYECNDCKTAFTSSGIVKSGGCN